MCSAVSGASRALALVLLHSKSGPVHQATKTPSAEHGTAPSSFRHLFGNTKALERAKQRQREMSKSA
eukprot:7970387-Alexandrium_andersonii.AAC.1